MYASLSLGDGPPFGLAVLCGNLVATCKQDRRLRIWIYPWISTQKSVDMDMDMDGKFHIHGKPADFSLKMHHKRLAARLRSEPRTRWGSLQRSPDLLAGFKIGTRDKGRRKAEKTIGGRQLREGTEEGREGQKGRRDGREWEENGWKHKSCRGVQRHSR